MIRFEGSMIWFWILTSWPLPEESLLTRLMGFLPNLRRELALKMSFSVVLLIGTVPSGQNSPEADHNWKFSAISSMDLFPLGLSGGSCSSETSDSLNQIHKWTQKFSATREKEEEDSDFNWLPMGSVLWAQDGQKQAGDEKAHSLWHHHLSSAAEQNKTNKKQQQPRLLNLQKKQDFQKNEEKFCFFYLNCLGWRLVDFA